MFAADGTRVGSEFLVNTATASATRYSADHGAVERRLRGDVAGLQRGRWRRDGGQQQLAVKAQVFHADGTRVGSEILVNTATANNQDDPQITALSNGGFVVTWSDKSLGVGGATGDNSGTAVKAQVFLADGTRVGSNSWSTPRRRTIRFSPADHGAVERRLRGDVAGQ